MPNRILKESICISGSLEGLSDFEENLFYRLIVNCDDYGRFDARPAILKSRCYPLRERLTLKTLTDALQSLVRAGCVELYNVDGKPYLHLPTWEVHQQVRAKKSKFPEPDSNGYRMISVDCICPRNPIQSESESESESNARAGGGVGAGTLFDDFWQAYPRKKSKGDAEKAWKAIKPSKELVATMLEKLAQAKTCHDWTKEGGKYIPYPATWLRAKGWEDEYSPSIAQRGYVYPENGDKDGDSL